MSIGSNIGFRLQKKFGPNIETAATPSRTFLPFRFHVYDTNKEIWENDEDFKELLATEREYKRRTISLINIEKLDMDTRENLICKIKKIWDTFELSDETFYNSVLINDFQLMVNESNKNYRKKQTLDQLFDFSIMSGGKEKCDRYQSFFDAVAWIVISIKFFEHEKESPLTKEILEFFELDNLAPILIKKPKGVQIVTDEMAIDVLFQFIFTKQIEILLKIDFKISSVSL